jgi:hypothetical protein
MAENTERKPTVKVEHREAAKLASSQDARNEASEKVLAEQLAQQDAARDQLADVIPDAEAPVRAAHAGEGGGAWPLEVLARRSINPQPPVLAFSPEQAYTSHETAE